MNINITKVNLIAFSIFLILFSLTACEQEEKNQGNYMGSSQRDDIDQLLTKDDIRSTFELADQVEIEHNVKRSAISSFDWESPEQERLFYSVKLNFARGDRRNNSQIDNVWESQNKMYKKHNPQEVSGVGEKATWSELGGGQLRVTANGYIFYVSFFITPKKENPLTTQQMIDKTSAMAEIVINRM